MTTTITIEPGVTPARYLPFAMVYDVCLVLEAHGLKVTDEALIGRGIVEVQRALLRVIDAVPAEVGGAGRSSSSSSSR